MQRMAEMGYDPDREFVKQRDFEAAYWSLRAEGKINPEQKGAEATVNTPPPTLPASGQSAIEPSLDAKINQMSTAELEKFLRQAGALK
jgi:hypothetical protein